MPIDDFTNWTPEHTKSIIHTYQNTKDEELFSLLLAKYDRYLVKISWKFHKQLNDVPLEDLYHSAIVGFGIAITQFKPQASAGVIMAVIKSYVRREIEAKYISKRSEEIQGFCTPIQDIPNPDDTLDAYFILNSDYLSKDDKELLALRFEENMPFNEIGKRLGVCRQWASKRLEKILNKIRKEIGEGKRNESRA